MYETWGVTNMNNTWALPSYFNQEVKFYLKWNYSYWDTSVYHSCTTKTSLYSFNILDRERKMRPRKMNMAVQRQRGWQQGRHLKPVFFFLHLVTVYNTIFTFKEKKREREREGRGGRHIWRLERRKNTNYGQRIKFQLEIPSGEAPVGN